MIIQFIKFRIYNSTHVRILLGVKLMIHFSYTWWFTNDMSTTHCGTNIVRIRVGLLNDILRFDYALCIFFTFDKLIVWFNCCSTSTTLTATQYQHQLHSSSPKSCVHRCKSQCSRSYWAVKSKYVWRNLKISKISKISTAKF